MKEEEEPRKMYVRKAYTNKYGKTALDRARRQNHAACVRLLEGSIGAPVEPGNPGEILLAAPGRAHRDWASGCSRRIPASLGSAGERDPLRETGKGNVRR